MLLPDASPLDRFAGWLPQLLACLLLLAVPGLGQPSPPRWRVAEEEEHNSRDTTESAACVTADGLRLRGRVIAQDRPPRALWLLNSGSIAAEAAIQSASCARRLAAGFLNGCGAFLRC